MGKINVPIECSACKAPNTLRKLRKPTKAVPVIAKLSCESCGSRFLLSLEKTEEQGRLRIDGVPIFLSQKAITLIKERNAAPEVEPPKETVNQDAQDNT